MGGEEKKFSVVLFSSEGKEISSSGAFGFSKREAEKHKEYLDKLAVERRMSGRVEIVEIPEAYRSRAGKRRRSRAPDQ